MIDPLFWLGLSILLVAVSLTALLVVAIPAFQELGRAARSAEKLFDTLSRELPPTLEAIRLTGLEISELTDDVSQGVQSAGQVAKQVDQSLGDVKQQAQRVQTTTRSVFAGFKAAWKTLAGSEPAPKRRTSEGDLPRRLSPGTRSPLATHSATEPERDYKRSPSANHRAYPETQPQANGADRYSTPALASDEQLWPPSGANSATEPRLQNHRSEGRPSRRPNPDDETVNR